MRSVARTACSRVWSAAKPMTSGGKDGGDDEFELDLDFDPSDQVTNPGASTHNSRSRKPTKAGGSMAPPPLDAPTLRPPDVDLGALAVPQRRSMIPGPGLDADNQDTRPTNPGGMARPRADSTQKIIRQKEKNAGAGAAAAPAAQELSEAECLGVLGSLERKPVVKVSPDRIFALGLDHRAGFLFSQIDGLTTLDDLISISPMTSVETLRIFVHFLNHGAIELSS